MSLIAYLVFKYHRERKKIVLFMFLNNSIINELSLGTPVSSLIGNFSEMSSFGKKEIKKC